MNLARDGGDLVASLSGSGPLASFVSGSPMNEAIKMAVRPRRKSSETLPAAPGKASAALASASAAAAGGMMRQSASTPSLFPEAEARLMGASSPAAAPRVSIAFDTIREAKCEDSKKVAAPEPSPSDARKHKERRLSRYTDLVAEQGLDLFRRCTDDTPNGVLDATAPGLEMRRLVETPSMIMLSEAARVLSESPSALTPLDAESTGGVYQLRRQQSFYKVPEASVPAPTLVRRAGPPRFFNSRKTGSSTPPPPPPPAVPLARPAPTVRSRSQTFSSRMLSPLEVLLGPSGGLRGSSGNSGGGPNSASDATPRPAPATPRTPVTPEVAGEIGAATLRKVATAPQDFHAMRRVQSAATMAPAAAVASSSGPHPLSSASKGAAASAAVARLKRRHASRLAVFKPEDEETGARVSRGLGRRNPERAGMVVGGGARRERAAYLLDKNIGRFSGVPATALVSSKLPDKKQGATTSESRYTTKRGSLQQFCESDGSADDRPDLVRAASAQSVHKIGVLDLRIFNTDRHGGNILCRRLEGGQDVQLIPIDHALSLPDWRYLAEAYFDWQYWAQADTNFDTETLEAIARIDVEADANTLRDLGFPEGCVATNTIASVVLKAGAAHGLHLRDLGTIFQRPFCAGHNLHDKYLSPLELMVAEACKACETPFEYRPSGSAPDDDEEEEDNTDDDDESDVDIDEKERKAFGDVAPPANFFNNFSRVVDRALASGEWRASLPI